MRDFDDAAMKYVTQCVDTQRIVAANWSAVLLAARLTKPDRPRRKTSGWIVGARVTSKDMVITMYADV